MRRHEIKYMLFATRTHLELVQPAAGDRALLAAPDGAHRRRRQDDAEAE